jgi:hypothetical protein
LFHRPSHLDGRQLALVGTIFFVLCEAQFLALATSLSTSFGDQFMRLSNQTRSLFLRIFELIFCLVRRLRQSRAGRSKLLELLEGNPKVTTNV